MASIQLWFAGVGHPQLVKTIFQHPLISEQVVAVRGQSTATPHETGSFPWKNGIRALCCLLIEAKLEPDSIHLCSDKNRLTKSLDYAIDKSPAWMVDVFGTDSEGLPLLRRLIHRSNPNGKRPGPIQISVKNTQLQSDDIKIYFDGQEVSEQNYLRRILETVTSGAPSRSSIHPTAEVLDESRIVHPDFRTDYLQRFSEAPSLTYPRPFDDLQWRKRWEAAVIEEIEFGLESTSIFDKARFSADLKSLHGDKRLHDLAFDSTKLLENLDRGVTGGQSVGLCYDRRLISQKLGSGRKLTLWSPIQKVSTNAPFFVLKYLFGAPIEWNGNFSAHNELLFLIAEKRAEVFPDLLILGIAQSAVLSRYDNSPYHPLMFLPETSFRRISQGTAPDASLDANFTSNLPIFDYRDFYADHLIAANYFENRDMTSFTKPADSKIHLLYSGKHLFRSMMWFPDYQFAEWFCGAKIENATPLKSRKITPEDRTVYLKGATNVLLIHERLLKEKNQAELLAISLRDAWITLRESPGLRKFVGKSFARSTDLLRCATRSAGLHELPRFKVAGNS